MARTRCEKVSPFLLLVRGQPCLVGISWVSGAYGFDPMTPHRRGVAEVSEPGAL